MESTLLPLLIMSRKNLSTNLILADESIVSSFWTMETFWWLELTIVALQFTKQLHRLYKRFAPLGLLHRLRSVPLANEALFRSGDGPSLVQR